MMKHSHEFYSYNPSKHKDAIHRLYLEVGWIEKGEEENLDVFLSGGKGWVTEIEGQAESLVHSTPGILRYLDEDLPASCVTGVLTSRIARKQGLATHLTAHAVAQDASEGAIVSLIETFEQGFYDQLGYGIGVYEHIVAFDPAKLQIDSGIRTPKRLRKDDCKIIHQSRLQRMRGHGALNILPTEFTCSAVSDSKNGFGLGYFDGPNGTLSHHLWIGTKNVVNGPYNVWWMAYQSYDQFIELLSLLKSFGDQIHLVKMHEPPGIQMQDFIAKPLKERDVSAQSKFESGIRSVAYWQLRICDLSACLNQTNLKAIDFHFNLKLDDPIEKFLKSDQPWNGLTGDYVIHLGSPSSMDVGEDPSLPTLEASVGAFSRMWFGVRPASGLSVTDNLSGPPDLIHQLDDAFRHPDPRIDWEF